RPSDRAPVPSGRADCRQAPPPLARHVRLGKPGRPAGGAVPRAPGRGDPGGGEWGRRAGRVGPAPRPPDGRVAMTAERTVYRGRLAPSPTGAQHVGNARSYLIAWLRARARGGRVVLRVEDIDSPRVKAGAAEQAEEDLRWLGLDWDEGPVVQTRRL